MYANIWQSGSFNDSKESYVYAFIWQRVEA
jgi:hypothetical protein